MLEKLSTLERITTLENIVDQLVEAKGREKCGLICVAGDLLKLLRNDVLILEEKVKDKNPPASETGVQLELVSDNAEGGENG
jgi:hypothetical protein